MSAKLKARVEELENLVELLKEQVADLESKNKWNIYDMSQIRAEHRVFLTYRITPLLNDAIDAIEIEVPDIALSRIRNVLRLFKELSATSLAQETATV